MFPLTPNLDKMEFKKATHQSAESRKIARLEKRAYLR